MTTEAARLERKNSLYGGKRKTDLTRTGHLMEGLMSSRAESAQSSTYENTYWFHHKYEMYPKLTAAAIVRTTRQPPKRACQYVPIAIPKVNIPNLKIPVCHHFNVKVSKIFMGHAFFG